MGYAERRKYIKFYFSNLAQIDTEDKERLHPLALSFMHSVALGMCLGIGLLWPILKLPFYQRAGFGVRKMVRLVTVLGPTTFAYMDSKSSTLDPFFQEMYEKYNTPKTEE